MVVIKKKKKTDDLRTDFMSQVSSSSDDSKRVSVKKDAIRYKIKKGDDDLVRMLKKRINKADITLQQIYDHVGNSSAGYNLYYALQKRTSVYFDTFQSWMDILGLDYKIKVFKKKK